MHDQEITNVKNARRLHGTRTAVRARGIEERNQAEREKEGEKSQSQMRTHGVNSLVLARVWWVCEEKRVGGGLLRSLVRVWRTRRCTGKPKALASVVLV